jgi:alpha-L-rhamnosidase
MMKTVPFIYLIFLLCHSPQLPAQPLIKTNWQAQWIGESGPSIANTFQRYRCQFHLDAVPAKIIAAIATDSKYWLWINGRPVVLEGQLKRGPTPNDTYYDEVDIKPYLQTGRNTIAILVWYWGKDGFCHKSSGKSGLLFEAIAGGTLIQSDEQWKTASHHSYQNSLPPHPNFRLPEHNIRYDARLDNEDWIQPGYDDALWKNAAILAKADAAPWNRLWKRPVPLWHNSELLNYENTFSGSDEKKIMKLPKNILVTPYFKIEAPAGLLVDVRTDNYYGGSEPNVRTEYITREGVQQFETPAFMNGHEVIYHFPRGVKILELKYRETKYNTNQAGSFSCSDAFLNTLWNKSFTTLLVNMRDGIQDSPDRERAQWWGDIAIVLEEIFYSCDSNGIAAIKKAISNLVEWQKPGGELFSPIPAGNWDKELPAQMLAAVGKYGIWKYIEHSGDTAMIRYVYPFIKKYMALWRLKEQGLVQHRTGGWDWHDWGDKVDVPLLDNAWYYMALDACSKMATGLKMYDEAAGYQKQMQSIAASFQKYFWKGNRFASDEYAFYADDRGNGLAVCAGLVSKEQWRQLKPVLDTTFHAGPYLEKYILESYFLMQDAAAGLARMKTRYEKMVNHPTITTLWEGWEIGSSTYGGGTYNHGWTGGPLSLMSAYVAGIRPAALGYGHYIIQPQLGALTRVSGSVLTARGFIKMNLTVTSRQVEITAETIDAKGIIALPKTGPAYKSITVNGRKKEPSFQKIKEDGGYVYFECNKKGRWTVRGEW